METRKTTHFIFNPFEKIAGEKALLIGTVFMITGSILAGLTNARFDGVLDLHFAEESDFTTALIDQLINIACLGLIFYITARISGARHTRPVDIAGTFLLAKAPYTILPLLNLAGNMNEIGEEIIAGDNISTYQWGVFILLILILILFVIWSIALMVNAYRVSTNLRGNKMIIGFIIALIVAEIISKILIQPTYF
jgi:hypothetical protein